MCILLLITGHNGTINGQGQSWWIKYRRKLLNYTRGPLVQIMWSSGILISNITLRDSPFWTLHLYDCKNITVRNMTILAPIYGAPNTDGIDPGKCFMLFTCSVNFILLISYHDLLCLISSLCSEVHCSLSCLVVAYDNLSLCLKDKYVLCSELQFLPNCVCNSSCHIILIEAYAAYYLQVVK